MFWSTTWQYPIAFTLQSAVDSSGSFIFNGFDISNCWTLSIDTANYDDMNRIALDTYDSPRIDWGGVLWYFVNGKILNIKLIVIQDTEEELNTMIDTLKLKLFKKEWDLKVLINWTYRTIKCSLTSLNFNRDFEKKGILTNVVMSFTAMNNFQDEVATYNTEVWVATPTLSLDIDNTWARTDYQVYMIFGAGVAWTNSITLGQDWYTLTVNETIADWDILVLDGIEKQVVLNGVAVDYDWPFVQIQNGSNPILISINWTYIADITWLYYVNYL